MPAAFGCGLANGLPSVSVVLLPTSGHNRVRPVRSGLVLTGWLASRLVAIGLSVAGCLLAGRALAAETAAQVISAPVRPPEIAAGQDDLKARSSMLEREQRWTGLSRGAA